MNPARPGLSGEPIIVVMDGACALCSRAARTLAAADAHDRFRIAVVQSPLGRRLLIEAGLDADDPESWLLIEDGRALTGARAALAAGRRLGFPWTALAALGRVLPGPVLEALYRVVARNRIAWFGRADLCALPDPGVRRRLIGLDEDA